MVKSSLQGLQISVRYLTTPLINVIGYQIVQYE